MKYQIKYRTTNRKSDYVRGLLENIELEMYIKKNVKKKKFLKIITIIIGPTPKIQENSEGSNLVKKKTKQKVTKSRKAITLSNRNFKKEHAIVNVKKLGQ